MQCQALKNLRFFFGGHDKNYVYWKSLTMKKVIKMLPRNPTMDKLVKNIATNPAFEFGNVCKSVADAMEKAKQIPKSSNETHE